MKLHHDETWTHDFLAHRAYPLPTVLRNQLRHSWNSDTENQMMWVSNNVVILM